MKYIAALDIGSTTVRCYIYNENAEIMGTGKDTMTLLYPRPRWVEMDPEEVWTKVQSVIKNAIKDAKLTSENISCLGISCQRGSTLTWQKSTGKPLHNFICWQDMRADKLMQSTNNSFILMFLRFLGNIGYFFTGSKFLSAVSNLQIYQGQPSLFLIWALENIEPLKNALLCEDAAFGTLSSWILYKLSKETLHIADASTLSTSGLFDTFAMKWSSSLLKIYKIPEHVLPKMVDAIGNPILVTDVFGAPIPVTACIADVSASMFGSRCFNKGDLNLILGTGTFANINTGQEIFISRSGAYPTVGWQIGHHVTYTMEGLCHNTAPVIKSALNIGLIDDPANSAEKASAVADTDGVVFIPAFSGLPVPVNDPKAAVGLIGVKVTTNASHILRAMLESIAFRVGQIFTVLKHETGLEFKKIRVSGGISKNDLIMKTVSTLTNYNISRPVDVETSALGAAYLAGIGAGVWKNQDSLPETTIPEIFSPCDDVKPELRSRFRIWAAAVPRFQNWYSHT